MFGLWYDLFFVAQPFNACSLPLVACSLTARAMDQSTSDYPSITRVFGEPRHARVFHFEQLNCLRRSMDPSSSPIIIACMTSIVCIEASLY